MNSYELSRSWFDWCFENPEKVKPIHSAVYFFAIEHCNRLGWKSKFGFPSQMAMEAIGVKKHQTFISAFNDIIEWGGFDLIQKSKNQYSANIISLIAMPKNGKALDKALVKHVAKQCKSIGQSKDYIDKQVTIEQITIVQVIVEHLNTVCNTDYKSTTKKTVGFIQARIKEGYTIEDFKLVIEFKNKQWGNDKDMKHYLRPETLFGNKFESYLQAAKKEAPKQTSTFVSCLKPEDLTY